jgi:glutamine phosphoribosylpyrophosphate amidotransferase
MPIPLQPWPRHLGRGRYRCTGTRGPGAQRHHRELRSLRAELQAKGYVFASQTDTEVIAHLVDSLYSGDLFEAVQAATPRLHGAYAIGVMHRTSPTAWSAPAPARR